MKRYSPNQPTSTCSAAYMLGGGIAGFGVTAVVTAKLGVSGLHI